MGKINDLTGMRFGNQIAISRAGRNNWRGTTWLCRCDCGNEHVVSSQKLLSGKSKSCGCLRKKIVIDRSTKHGLTAGKKPRLFTIWNDMKARCLNHRSISYRSYGMKGVTICDEWLDFESFYRWAVSNGYSDELTIDRIDNNGNYEPSNCHWITASENKSKQRKSIMILGKSLSANAKSIGISRYMLTKYYRSHSLRETEYFINKFIGNQ